MNEGSQTTNDTRSRGLDGKTIAIVAYLTLIGLIVAYVLNTDKKDVFASFHIRQSLGLGVIGLGLMVLGMVPILGWLISFFGSLFLLFLWIMGLLNAINAKQQPVPILGKRFMEWFRNL